MHTDSSTVPTIVTKGDGIEVNGAFVSGDVMLAWFTHAADRGYVLKFDAASTAAFERTDDLGSIPDAIRNLLSVCEAI